VVRVNFFEGVSAVISLSRMRLLAGLGALGAAGGLVAIFAFFVFLSLPYGIDRTEAAIAMISVGLLFLVLVLSHVVYGRILLAAARGKHFGL
jgi:NADH:ubiquinone oxidoreductase subunit H